MRGTLALGHAPEEQSAAPVFADQFGDAPASEAGRLAISASHQVTGQRASLWSLGPSVFWDAARQDYVRVSDGPALDAVAPLVRAGTAYPALDDCTVFQDREGVLLFASGSGATTFYYTEHGGVLVFANRPQPIRAARSASLDRLGAGEIVRFGANYGRRTLLEGIQRIPIGHLLESMPGRAPIQRAFADYSHRPAENLDEPAMREAIGKALDRNLALIEGPRDLLFSGGVDSTLLALRGVSTGTIHTGWFYAVSDTDPEAAIARRSADTIGLRLETVQDSTAPDDIIRRIAAYALPTLDFSIVPTHALGSAVAGASKGTTFIDGTGGDAWFGFGSLAHADAWHPLHRLRALSPAARRLYMAMLEREDLALLKPLKGLARTPRRPSAGLGHMCANPVYSALLDLSGDEWLQVEDEVLTVLRSLSGGEAQSAAGEVIVSDACLIAVAQFAAKTSQWDVGAQSATAYPFLMPNMVALGRTTPRHALIRDGHAKPLLKDIVAASPLGRDFAYRRKSGFQPPLQRLLQSGNGRAALFSQIGAGEAPWTEAARRLPERLLRGENSLRIGGLYAIWARLGIEFWLKTLRQ